MESKWLSDKGYFPLAVRAGKKFPFEWKGGGTDPDWRPEPFESPNLSIRRDGLIPIDIDVEDRELALRLLQIIAGFCKEQGIDVGPIRTRANSPKCTIVFRCPELEQSHLFLQTGVWKDKNGKTIACVEFKGGWSYQTLTHGTHPTGAQLTWNPGGPHPQNMVPKHLLPVLTIAQAKALCKQLDEEMKKWLGPPTKPLVSKDDFTDRYELTDEMEFTSVDGDVWTVAELKTLRPGRVINCHLDGVRPTSDSGAGLARVGPQGLVITDLAHGNKWRPAHEPGMTDREKKAFHAIQAGEAPTLDWVEKGRSPFVFISSENKYIRHAGRDSTLYPAAGLVTQYGKEGFKAILALSPKVDALRWDPLQKPRAVFVLDGITYFNTYWRPEQVEGGDSYVVREFVQALCGSWADWVENWLASKIQKPWQKGVTLTLVGPQGCGKSTLWRLISQLVGPHQVSNSPTMQGALDGRYHDYKYKTLFAFFHEVHASQSASYRDKQGVASNYKEICDTTGDATAQLNIKGKNQERAPVMCTVGISTNYPDALPLEPDDRRTMVIAVQMVDKKLIARLSREMGIDLDTQFSREAAANRWATYAYYKSRDVGSFDAQNPPWTAAKRRMIEGNETTSDQVCDDFIHAVRACGGCYTREQMLSYAARRDMQKGELAGYMARMKSISRYKRGNSFRFSYLAEIDAPAPQEARIACDQLAKLMCHGDETLKSAGQDLKLV